MNVDSDPEPWSQTAETELGDFRFFKLREVTAVSPRTGAEHGFFLLDSRDWINVIALTPENEVVLVRQYRFGTQRVELEIPGGLTEPGETPEQAARRELEEETGYRGGEATYLGSVSPNPAMFTNRCHTVLVQGVSPDGERELDPGEDIAVETRPLAEIPTLIAKGEIRHALVMCAFQLLGLAASDSL